MMQEWFRAVEDFPGYAYLVGRVEGNGHSVEAELSFSEGDWVIEVVDAHGVKHLFSPRTMTIKAHGKTGDEARVLKGALGWMAENLPQAKG